MKQARTQYLKEWFRKNSIDPRMYRAWTSMRYRCEKVDNLQWKDYGGRGINVCNRWHVFANFVADMGPHPGKGWSLDRKNNNGDYRPSNCRWATQKTQTRNSRMNRITSAKVALIRSSTLSQYKLARQLGCSPATVRDVRIGRTWV